MGLSHWDGFGANMGRVAARCNRKAARFAPLRESTARLAQKLPFMPVRMGLDLA